MRESRMAVEGAWEKSLKQGSEVLSDVNPPDETERRIVHFESEPDEVEALRRTLPPEVLLEPQILYHAPKPWAMIMPAFTATKEELIEAKMKIQVIGSGNGLLGSEVTLVLVNKTGVSQETHFTDKDGSTVIEFDSSKWSPGAETVAPAGGFWSMVQASESLNVSFNCPPLSVPGPLAWWHQVLNVKELDLNRGNGIKVGVIDTGCGPHPCLDHVDNLGSLILGQRDPYGGTDGDIHGTHICGLLGARPQTAGQLAGLSPGATIMSIRVYPPGDAGANQGDVAQAIDLLSKEYGADLLNLSLTADDESQIEHDAIIDAMERGTLCLAASGNLGGAIGFPAAFSEVASVGALGLKGWGPAGSVSAALVPTSSDRFAVENLFVPNFCNSGPTLGCTAPGIGIISTFPARYGLEAPYADFAGTSCATPLACAVLASLLSGMSEFYNSPRTRARAELAKRVLFSSCRKIGLAQSLQGNGLPQGT